MRYLMIPLRHLVTTDDERVSADIPHDQRAAVREEQNARKRRSLLRDVARHQIPSWCVSEDDLEHNARIVEGPDLSEWPPDVQPAPPTTVVPS
jgi:hypothetical protein